MAEVVRLLLLGDPVAAGQWAGYAKKLARFCIRDGFPQKTVIVGDVQIDVRVAGNDARVTIKAGEERFYQFANTTPLHHMEKNLAGVEFSLASGVAVRLPPIRHPGDLPAWTETRAFPLGSTIEGDENSRWVRYPATFEEFDKIMWARGIDMVTFVPEPVYVGVRPSTERTTRLLYSWASIEGQIRMANVFSPVPAFIAGDVGYDASPTFLVGGRQPPWQTPDADWPHDACVVLVDGGDYGTRRFVVMADAFGTFHCWPTGSDKDPSLSDAKPQYAAQSYRANIPDSFSKSVVPPYPAWVERPTSKFRDHSKPPKQSQSPRNVVRFHPYGTKAVVLAMERRTVNWTVYHQQGRDDEQSFAAKVRDWGQFGDDPSHEADPALDVPGWCEFAIAIEVTGAEPQHFSFAMTLIGQELASGAAWPIAASYLGPVPEKTWADRGITGNVGDLIVAYLKLNESPKVQEVVDRNLGWHGPFLYYSSHGWVSVFNHSQSIEYKKIPTYLTDESAFDLKTIVPFPAEKAGYFLKLDLATLSWVVVYQVNEQTLGSTIVGTKSGIGGVLVNVLPVTLRMGLGLETVVYGKVERRKQVGALDPFSWVDSFSPQNQSFLIEKKETWFPGMSGLAGNFSTGQNNWLLDKSSYYLGAALAEKRIDEGDPDWLPTDKAQFTEITNKLLEDKRDYAPYNETEPRFVGPHSHIQKWHQQYTPAYWETIVNELWTIFQDAIARKNAGDNISLTNGDAYYTKVCNSVTKIMDNIGKLTDAFPAEVYWPRIYNAEVGILAYSIGWMRAFRNIGDNYNLKLLDNGYYAGAYTVVYHVDPITSMIYYKSQASNQFHAAGNSFDTSKDTYTWLFANYPSIIPDIGVSGMAFVEDFIRHINGGTEITHLYLYNEAYEHSYTPLDYIYSGTTEIISGNIIHSIEDLVKIEGTLYLNTIDSINTLFGMYTFSTNKYVKKLNCGMQMV